MSPDISERKFEEDIEAALVSSGYQARDWQSDFDRERGIVHRDVLDFVYATQPREWEKLKQQYGAEVRERFLTRLARQVQSRGTLDVLRKGFKDSGCKFRLVYFQPVSGLNEDLRKLYEGNIFSVVRQLHYSQQNENSLDLGLFLNGLPLFTAELKNPFNGQDVQNAIKQYQYDRDPKEPFLSFRRCLAHFAVDPDLVYVTTELKGTKTRFLPFNIGKYGGAGNPPVPPSEAVNGAYSTSYLWTKAWAPDSALNLIQHFIHEFEEEDDKGKKTGERFLIFPRYQQLDAVRRLVVDARENGPGKRYLIQHSAGSGKSNSIAWLAHQLASLHDANDETVFDSVVVITDRRVLDRQLQKTIRQFEQTSGVVENIDTTSRQLKEALEAGKKIIVTTLQKFPVISEQISSLPGQRFAVIVDEAHSSQTGESTKHLKMVLAASSLESAEDEDTTESDVEDKIMDEIRARGPLENVSHFAFTATPKARTLELFGEKQTDGTFEPFSLYSMRQAIEEGFILDVLENYTTYKTYWRLLKTIEDDPRYEKGKAEYLLKSFVDLHEHSIDKKINIIVEHFHDQIAHRINGTAKAMIVTRSRLHAVRYFLALRKHLADQGLPYKALVAFSGTVRDAGADNTEANLNDVSETQTANTFAKPEYRFLVVANKFQTGFDQPLLHTMYVDKKLGGVGAVQTLSRLNRTHPDKEDTVVIDFANEADEIKKAFDPYYERTILSEGTDPNLLYDLETQLLQYDVYGEHDVAQFADTYFSKEGTQDQLYQLLAPHVERFDEIAEEEQQDFRHKLTQYIRLYAFLSQIIPFADPDLEKLYVFARLLRKLLPVQPTELPREIQEKIDLESLRIQPTSSGKIPLERGSSELDPQDFSERYTSDDPEELLSRIIDELNNRFGAQLSEEDHVTLRSIIQQMDKDETLDKAVKANTRENVRLTFDNKLQDSLQDIVDSNFKLYKRFTDDKGFGEALLDYLFDAYMSNRRQAEELIKLGESKTVEFKSTLRWNLKEEKKDPKVITQSALKTIAAFLNTEGGDLLIGVEDSGNVLGISLDQFDTDDKFMLHLSHVVQSGLGALSVTRIDPRVQLVDGKGVCVVSCQRSPEPVYLKWKGLETSADGDFFVRGGPGTIKLDADDAQAFINTRF